MPTNAVFPYAGKSITTNRLKGSGTEPVNSHWGTGSETAAASDTALTVPSPDEARSSSGTSSLQTTSVPNDTYQVQSTLTCATNPKTVTEHALFDTAVAAPQTTLAAAITTTTQTSISVAANAGFPGTGQFDIQIDGETMTVTGGQGTNTWTVTRGARGSTAATHASAAAVVGGQGTAGGNMFFKATFTGIALNAGDSIAFTDTVQYQ